MDRAGYSGASYDRYVERTDQSTTHRLKNAYWTTKQAVIRKLGRKEDEHVVASDAELDAKLELFKSVQRSCVDLIRVIEKYQERLCCLSQTENETGRFLKNKSQPNKNQAGKMMAAVGKSLSFSSQQRLALRVPLSRLQQEVETFRFRAVADTLMTIRRMEEARTDYRGALLWMKNVSDELDPDTYKQLERFRKVQAQVRKTKARFDKLKLDSMQKVDLLAASRCNMFSHVLALYQSTLLQFWEKTCRTMTAVAESFKGYQYYEFNMLKCLADESKKLAEMTQEEKEEEKEDEPYPGEGEDPNGDSTPEFDLLGGEEEPGFDVSRALTWHDPNNSERAGKRAFEDEDDDLDRRLEEIFMKEYKDDPEAEAKGGAKKNRRSDLLDDFNIGAPTEVTRKDLLSGDGIPDNKTADEHGAFLAELLGSGVGGELGEGQEDDEFTREWRSVFAEFNTAPPPAANAAPLLDGGNLQPGSAAGPVALSGFPGLMQPPNQMQQQQQQPAIQPPPSTSSFMPSYLLDQTAFDLSSLQLGGGPHSVTQASQMASAQPAGAMGVSKPAPASQTPDGQGSKDWLSLFADLDPLSNPDALSKKDGQITDA